MSPNTSTDHFGRRRVTGVRALRLGVLLMTVLGAGLVFLAGCDQNSRRLSENEPVPPPPVGLRVQMGLEPAGGQSALERGTPPGIAGSITIRPELADQVGEGAVLFLIARSPGGPPVAAKRVVRPEFPMRYFLGQEGVMFEGQELAGTVEISVHVSQQGVAGEPAPGDLLGEAFGNPVAVGATDIEIEIDERVDADALPAP